VVAPLAAALAFAEARRAWGTRRAALEFAALVAYGFLLERVAMTLFASHRYAEAWTLAPLGVPLAVAVVWAAVILSCAALAPAEPRARRVVSAALLAVTLDLGIEPAAVRAGLWRWTPPGPWLDVPIGNSVGWAVIVGGYTWGLERWPLRGGAAAALAFRLALAAGCIAALVAVGLAWTSAGTERLFEGGGGWVAWALVLAATVAAFRGGARRAPLAALTLLVVALTFLADALGGGSMVLLASLGPAVVIAGVAGRRAGGRRALSAATRRSSSG
jgi:hypothetical protein